MMFGERVLRSNGAIYRRVTGRARRFVACAICLSVQHDGAWIEAGDAIRRLRTFERQDIPRLGEALCDRCQMELWQRRRGSSQELAA
jgi:hypothetical protein